MSMRLRSFWKSEEGVALAYFAVALPAMLLIGVMVIDVGRGNNLHLDLQNAADGLALAAAAELDGGTEAIVRANRAIDNLVENQARFGEDGPVIIKDVGGEDVEAQIEVRFLNGLPPDDDDEITEEYETDDAAEAQFVEVRVLPITYSLLFPVSLIDQDSVQVGAVAVAGFTSAICDITPMFICNPYEGTGTSLEQAASSRDVRRRMIVMRQKGPSSAWGPGNFGYLQSGTGDHGANALREMFAVVKPEACFDVTGVELSTGQQSTIRVGVNTRFDIYDGNLNSKKNNSNYRPARSVRKQYKFTGAGNACNATLTPDSGYKRLQRDSCINTSTCPTYGAMPANRMGDGIWDFQTYWSTNFPNVAYPTVNGETWSNSSDHLPTRYEVYRYEIDNNLTNTKSIGSNVNNPNGERGAPQCSGSTTSDDPDRRLLYAAIINCEEHADDLVGGSGDPIPVEAFASVFLTEPLENGSAQSNGEEDNGDDSIRAELVDITGRFGNGTLEGFQRDEVQLYR